MTPVRDLWETLAQSNKTVVLYGMGNGADKILEVCQRKGIEVSGVFASDGFSRGNLFHGMPVMTWAQTKEKWGSERLIVLLSFGTSRPEVLENILRIHQEAELYVPDVPAFGDSLFDRAFFETHREELAAARALLCDDESRRIFDLVVEYKLTGSLDVLLAARSDENETWETILRPLTIRSAADLGAYNGDTVRELIARSNENVQQILAMEPDARNYRKLLQYAEGETRACVTPIFAGAWSDNVTLTFEKSGNRNASFDQNRSGVLDVHASRLVEISARTLDSVMDGRHVDYIKYDVEGSEKEALLGSRATVGRDLPTLLVSLYHRSEDLFALPLLIKEHFPDYSSFYLRRFGGLPAWDLNLYVKK